jgi:predicted DNA-binding transcriptional regulator AlpA
MAKAPNNLGEESLLISAAKVGSLLDVHERTVWRMRSAGEIPPPIKVGPRKVRWRRAEILNWIEQGCPRHRPKN